MIYGPSLLARGSGWGPGASGLIAVGWLVWGIVVTAVIARHGASRRIGLAVGIGLLMIAVGLLGAALAPSAVVAFAGTVLLGVGVSICTGHLWPAYLDAIPEGQLGRYQSLLVFVQMTTLLGATILFTAIAGQLGVRWSFGCCGVIALATLIRWRVRARPQSAEIGMT